MVEQRQPEEQRQSKVEGLIRTVISLLGGLNLVTITLAFTVIIAVSALTSITLGQTTDILAGDLVGPMGILP